MTSLFGEERVCYICGSPNVERHHVFPSARRNASEREGCTVYLCHEHHQGRTGVHMDRELDTAIKTECQRRWELRSGLHGEEAHDAFRDVFYVSYL